MVAIALDAVPLQEDLSLLGTTGFAPPASIATAGPTVTAGGRVVEFLVVGGATPLLYAISWALRHALGLDLAELAVGFTLFHLAYVLNDPHFAVTYVLFYKDARSRALGSDVALAQRARYVVAGLVVPVTLGVWALAALSAKSTVALGWMFEAMFALVGWHYVKQGFGVTLVLSSRRGVVFAPRERAALLAHCLAGWAYAWARRTAPAHEAEVKGVVYLTLPRPAIVERAAVFVFAATTVVLVVTLLAKWWRERRLPLVTPLAALLASVWAWSIYASSDPLVRYMVPALHSVQYLYFVALLKGNEAREREGPPWFDTAAKARVGLLAATAIALGWVLFHGAPSLLDDALVPRRSRFTDLGATPYFAAIYAFVNIHHYFMDTVIWRRDNPLTRYLRVSSP